MIADMFTTLVGTDPQAEIIRLRAENAALKHALHRRDELTDRGGHAPDGTDDVIFHWCYDVIEGPGGCEEWELSEMAEHYDGDRVGAVDWAIRVLGNSRTPTTQAVFAAIAARRADVANGAAPEGWPT